MTGADIREEDLLAYADDRLDATRRAAVEAWLAEHPEEAARVAAWREQNALLRGALDPVTSEPVPPELNTALRETPRRRWRAPTLAAAIATLIAFPVGLAVGHYFWDQPLRQEAMAIATAGLDAHKIYAVEVRHPVEVGADEEQHLVTWLTKRLDVPVKAPDLSADGLRLLGGRLIPSGDKPAALLMYEGENGERFTLLIERATPQAMTAFRYTEAGNIGAFYWIDGPAGYALSGPADRVRLLKIARAVYEQLES
jgi:anti-sigma factor RsiW